VLRREIRPTGAVAERDRFLFVANANVPTLQLSFEKPLAPLVARGEITTELLTERRLRKEPELLGHPDIEADWIDTYLDRYDPSVIVFCRYSGPAHRRMMDWAKRQGVPVLYHIDDDLLAIPPDVGERKHALHNSPERLATVRELLQSADLVYASTSKLRRKLLEYFPGLPVVAGKIYCSGSVIEEPSRGPTRKIGYMASADHAHNLEIVLPAIEQMLERNPQVEFQLFGSIPVPERLLRFGDRISKAPPIANYERFLTEFAAYRWDVGICPLSPIEFNLMKANTKWVEYTSVGAAVVASRGTVYDDCCADGCGILADGTDEWLAALELLISDNEERLSVARGAQEKLEREYSVGKLREQVLEMISRTRAAMDDQPRHDQKAEAFVS
jgi:glycosyltransferase involved in cell wall biosynthesis